MIDNRVIHIITNIQTIFGRLDEEGNVVENVPVTLQINNLRDETFLEAAVELRRQREILVLQLREIVDASSDKSS